jgi:hypothetical protein
MRIGFDDPTRPPLHVNGKVNHIEIAQKRDARNTVFVTDVEALALADALVDFVEIRAAQRSDERWGTTPRRL